jgi:N-acetylmuramoyl-L-alanine amidase
MRWSRSATVLLLLAVCLFLPPAVDSADEKRISVYSTLANYSLPVVDRDGREYVGLLEILEPLGSVSSRVDAQRWKLRYKKIEAEFTVQKSRARIAGHDTDMPAPFILENGRGLVPLSSLPAILPKFLGGPVTLRENARRLFVGGVSTQVTVDLVKTTPPRLLFNFSGPVNPNISTEPGHLRMTFTRDPVIAGNTQWKFDDQSIPSATFSENNGAAEITVNSAAPLMASFTAGGRTITVTNPPALSAPTPPNTAARSATSAPPPAPGSSVAPPIAAGSSPSFVVVIDASHGGTERGAALTNDLAEKDVTLAFARLLRKELEARGIGVVMLRDSDLLLSVDQRAAMANARRSTLYLNVHAASQGTGVRIYSASVPNGSGNRGAWIDWDTAQTSALPASRDLVNAASSELQKRKIAVRILPAPLRPLNNVLSPAIAIELAPPSANVSDINSATYQQPIAAAIADIVSAQKPRLEATR